LIECPNCSGQIIEEAVKCKHCGERLKSYAEMINDTTNKTSPDFFPIILGIPLLLCLHYMSGYYQTPQIVIDVGLSRGLETIHMKLGYGLGMVLFYALPIPILFGLISLFIEKRRNLFSFIQVIFWSMIITLVLNLAVGFLIVPKALEGISYEEILKKHNNSVQ
jgi:hypothetical protein